MSITNSKFGYSPANGIKIYYEIYGSGKPLVLIHGGGSSGFCDFEETVKRLQEHYQLIVLDMQNHGRSEHRKVPETFEQDARDIVKVLDYLAIVKASFFGFSNGATTILKFASLFPGRVDKLIAASGNTKRAGLLDGFFDSMATSTIEVMPPYLKENFLKINPDPEDFKNMYEKDSQRMINFQDFEAGTLEDICCPVFLIGGDQDVVKGVHLAEMQKQLPNARLMILPANHGNYMMKDFDGEIDEGLIDFTIFQVKKFLEAK
ncbi:alpha/beta fold hydrolase [Sphingobacterium prati]|uniref:alpha/beta fold hydrolase n=1 Tax=Sphingobacterium prati TaxID=2737006 RepID=UPI001556BE30|nr:alpha/beta hydrolase [Sphingobacterium prati]NPE47321.1 alpha/beta hydrolase [Sphingobacterium prati]